MPISRAGTSYASKLHARPIPSARRLMAFANHSKDHAPATESIGAGRIRGATCRGKECPGVRSAYGEADPPFIFSFARDLFAEAGFRFSGSCSGIVLQAARILAGNASTSPRSASASPRRASDAVSTRLAAVVGIHTPRAKKAGTRPAFLIVRVRVRRDPVVTQSMVAQYLATTGGAPQPKR